MSVAAVLRGTDNGDGAYTNPVLSADYPDPEIIRVDLEPEDFSVMRFRDLKISD